MLDYARGKLGVIRSGFFSGDNFFFISRIRSLFYDRIMQRLKIRRKKVVGRGIIYVEYSHIE